MLTESCLTKVDFWQKALGLLPVPLFPSNKQEGKFVLLNGSKGNFCLDITLGEADVNARNYAWSSNVGHYIKVNNYIEVLRWDQRASMVERYSSQSVLSDLEKFHAYLESDTPKRGISVISHAIGVFRRLRAVLGPSYSGADCLQVFLFLIACTADQEERNLLDNTKWRLTNKEKSLAQSINNSDWDALLDEMMCGRPDEDLIPDINLMLRHSSGQLFQEAHYEALFIPQNQLSLNGFLASTTKLGSKIDSLGVHFTPPALARTVVEEALFAMQDLPNEVVIFDPACGSGEFLRETIRQLDQSSYSGKVRLIGWDISEAAVSMANFLLSWEIRNTKKQIEMDIKCKDSLNSDWPLNADFILMNPPFASWQGMTADQRALVRKILGKAGRPRPDLSYVFLQKASRCLKQGGVLGSIIPASILDGYSAESLRKDLSDIMSPRIIARLGSPILFSGAIIDAGIYVSRKGKQKTDGPIAFWADYRSGSSASGFRSLRRARYTNYVNLPVIDEGFSIYRNPSIGKDSSSWAPRPYNSWELLNSLSQLPKVIDLFDVKQGIRTGYLQAFSLSKEEWFELPKEEQYYFRPAVVNKSIRHGYLDDSQYVFYPHGESTIASENELMHNVNSFYSSHLKPNKEQLLSRARVNPIKWWELILPRTWQLSPNPKLVSTYFGNVGSFAWDRTGKFVVLQGFAWLPKKDLVPQKVYLAYLTVLTSSIFSELLSAVSNNVGGGQWNLSKKFVDKIALPDLFRSNDSLVTKLASIGEAIYEGEFTQQQELDQLVREVYDQITGIALE